LHLRPEPLLMLVVTLLAGKVAGFFRIVVQVEELRK
jgi:hypothetical protein